MLPITNTGWRGGGRSSWLLAVLLLGCAVEGSTGPSDAPSSEPGATSEPGREPTAAAKQASEDSDASSEKAALGQTDDAPGGMSEDWTSLAAGCTPAAWIPFDDDSKLGYAPRHVLDLVEGRFVIPVSWSSGCDEAGVDDEQECAPFRDLGALALAGTRTEATIEVHPIGEEAHVIYPDDEESGCASAMAIPARVRVELADGSVSMEVDTIIKSAEPWSALLVSRPDCPPGCEACPPFCDEAPRNDPFGYGGPAAWLGGSLGRDLPDGIEASLKFSGRRYRPEWENVPSGDTVVFIVHVEAPGADGDSLVLLWGEEQSEYILRADVQR